MGVGDSWGTREELLHPRDSKGRFRSKWKMAAAAVDRLLKITSAFAPKTWPSDADAATYMDGLGTKTKGKKLPLDNWSQMQADIRAGKGSKDLAAYQAAEQPLPEDLILTSVMDAKAFGLTPETLPQIEEYTGKLVANKGPTSTNVGTPVGPGQVTLSIATPKGTMAVVPGGGSREVILSPEQPLRITKVDPDGKGGFYVYAVAMPKGEKGSVRTKKLGTRAPTPTDPDGDGVPGVADPNAPQVQAPAAGAPAGKGAPRSEPIQSPSVGADTPAANAPAADTSAPSAPETPAAGNAPEAGKPDAGAPASDPDTPSPELDDFDKMVQQLVVEELAKRIEARAATPKTPAKDESTPSLREQVDSSFDADMEAMELIRRRLEEAPRPLPDDAVIKALMDVTDEQIASGKLTKDEGVTRLLDWAMERDGGQRKALRDAADRLDAGRPASGKEPSLEAKTPTKSAPAAPAKKATKAAPAAQSAKATPTKKTAAKATPSSDGDGDIDNATIPALRQIAKDEGISVPSSLRRKADIQAHLKSERAKKRGGDSAPTVDATPANKATPGGPQKPSVEDRVAARLVERLGEIDPEVQKQIMADMRPEDRREVDAAIERVNAEKAKKAAPSSPEPAQGSRNQRVAAFVDDMDELLDGNPDDATLRRRLKEGLDALPPQERAAFADIARLDDRNGVIDQAALRRRLATGARAMGVTPADRPRKGNEGVGTPGAAPTPAKKAPAKKAARPKAGEAELDDLVQVARDNPQRALGRVEPIDRVLTRLVEQYRSGELKREGLIESLNRLSVRLNPGREENTPEENKIMDAITRALRGLGDEGRAVPEAVKPSTKGVQERGGLKVGQRTTPHGLRPGDVVELDGKQRTVKTQDAGIATFEDGGRVSPDARVKVVKLANQGEAPKVAKDKPGTIVSAKKPTQNTWGGAPGPVHYHPDGEIGQAVAGLGADGRLDVDGEPLADVLGKLATATVMGELSAQDQVARIRQLSDRMPAGSSARQRLEALAQRLDAPNLPAFSPPATAPKALRDLYTDLIAIPEVRRNPDRELEPLKALMGRAAGGGGGRLLQHRVLQLRNKVHESREGKFDIDRAIEKAEKALKEADLKGIATEQKAARSRGEIAEGDVVIQPTPKSIPRVIEATPELVEALRESTPADLRAIARREKITIPKELRTKAAIQAHITKVMADRAAGRTPAPEAKKAEPAKGLMPVELDQYTQDLDQDLLRQNQDLLEKVRQRLAKGTESPAQIGRDLENEARRSVGVDLTMRESLLPDILDVDALGREQDNLERERAALTELYRLAEKLKLAPTRSRRRREAPPPDPEPAGLRASAKTGVKKSRNLTGGVSADTELVTFNDGKQAVRKKAKSHPRASSRRQADTEELASIVARTLGLLAPRVEREDDGETVLMEYVPDARTGDEVRDEIVGLDGSGVNDYLDIGKSDDGILLGLLDTLIDNSDRNSANWLVDESGRIIPIDHGQAFTMDLLPGGSLDPSVPPRAPGIFAPTFRELPPGGGGLVWKENPLHPQDIAAIRQRLLALQPQFERLGRGDWFDYMMGRLDAIAPHAKGKKRLVPDA